MLLLLSQKFIVCVQLGKFVNLIQNSLEIICKSVFFPRIIQGTMGGHGWGMAYGHIKAVDIFPFPHQRNIHTEGLQGRHALSMLGRTLHWSFYKNLVVINVLTFSRASRQLHRLKRHLYLLKFLLNGKLELLKGCAGVKGQVS